MKLFPIALLISIFLLSLLIGGLLWLRSDTGESNPVPGDIDYDISGNQDTTQFPNENKEVAYLPQGYLYKTDKKDFDKIFSVVPSQNLISVLDKIYLDYYSIVPCRYRGYEENVIRLVFDDSISSRQSMSDYGLLVYGWESDIAKDIGDIIFPNISMLEREKVLQFSKAEEEGFRVAPLKVKGDERLLYYGFAENVLYIAGSMECIESVDSAIWGPNHDHG